MAADMGYPRSVMAALAGQLREGIAIATPDLEGPGPLIVLANAALANILGRTPESMVGEPLVSTLDPLRAERLLERLRAEPDDRSTRSEESIVRTGGAQARLVAWDIAPVTSDDGQVLCWVSTQRDVTDAALRRERSGSGEVDPLTGLPGRASFLAHLGRTSERVDRGEGRREFAVIGLELSGLGDIERDWGPVIANVVIAAAAWRVRRCLRPTDVVARLAPGRLGVLVQRLDGSAGIGRLRDRVRAALTAPYVVGGRRMEIRLEGGILPVMGDGAAIRTPGGMLDELEQCLAKGRAKGTSGTLEIFSWDEDEPGTGRADLLRALERDELALYYQPVIAVEHGRAVGLEALLRWRHPHRGLLPAQSFLPGAREAGLIVDVGRWVLRAVCRQLARWRETYGTDLVPAVHVNLSADEFWDSGIVAHVRDALTESGVRARPPGLRLEVREAILMRDPRLAGEILSELRQLGVEVWLEGFGGDGLSPLELVKLPFDHLKLDPAAVWKPRNGDAARRTTPLFAALLHLTHDLGWVPIAPDVETRAERDLIRAASCELGQGYAFSGPLAADAVPALFGQRR